MSRTPDEEHDRLEALAQEQGLPEPPPRPRLGECCERGCDPCIWDYYEKALARWIARHMKDESRWS